MTRFYLMRGTSDPQIMGIRDGVSMLDLKNESFKNSADEKMFLEFFRSFDQITQKNMDDLYGDIGKIRGYLSNKSKLIDYMPFSPGIIRCKYVVSRSVKEVIEKHKLHKVFFYPIELWQKEKIVPNDYYLLVVDFVPYNAFNFPNCVFLVRRKEVVYNSLEDFVISNTLNLDSKISIKKEYFEDYDLFYPRIGKITVSEKLKGALESFVGMNFIEKPNYIFIE